MMLVFSMTLHMSLKVNTCSSETDVTALDVTMTLKVNQELINSFAHRVLLLPSEHCLLQRTICIILFTISVVKRPVSSI